MDNTYEVQTLKDGRWMIEHRCHNENEAIAEARDLFESRHIRGVKVVKEMFDQAAKLYRETTVFTLPKEGQTVQEPSRPKQDAGISMVKRKKTVQKKRGLLDFLFN